MGIALDQLPPAMRAQAEAKLEQQATPRRNSAPMVSKPEEALAYQLSMIGFEKPMRELRFHSTRRWRFDFAWPDHKVACEVEGLTRQGGRHQRIEGFEKDLEKYEAAMLDGWNVYRVSPAMIKSGRALTVLAKLLGCEPLLDQ